MSANESKNVFTLTPLGPIFPTGPGKPYIQKMEKTYTIKNNKIIFIFKKSFTVFDMIRFCCCAAAQS